MKKAKKLLVTLLVLTFVLSTVSVGFAADNSTPASVTRAQALGILKGDEKGNLNLDQPITRAEALALIVRISGLEGSANLMKGQTKFADVNSDPGLQWATGYINLGVGQGIVNGYPDGTFKGRNTVTYAEMAKLLLYAMNYGITVEGAPWPAGVMGKADDLDLFDGVNASPNVPALRGAVVEMIDNSLTVKHLVQEGYGDLKTYKEGDKTFLSKLKVTELKDVKVTDIAKVNSKLNDDEIKLDGDVYTLKADVTPEEIFGLTVDAWVNDDDEVFFVKVKTAEDDILYDTVTAKSSKDVELKVEDDTFDWADDAVVYENFKKIDPKDVTVGAYGKVVLEKGEVIFANFFNFSTKAGLVTEVKGDKISYNINASDKTLNLGNYDNVYAYNAQFKAINTADIKADSLIYTWEKNDDLYLVVAGKAVNGKLERVKTTSATIDGESYDVASNATASDNSDDDISLFVVDNALADAVKNLAGEEVTGILDLNGELRHVRGEAEATSGDLYGLATDAYRNGAKYVINIFNAKGEDVALEVEEKTNWTPFSTYFESNPDYIPVVYQINKDGKIEKDTIKVVAPSGTYGNGFEYLAGVIDTSAIQGAAMDFDKDDDYIKFNNKYYFIDSDTVMMKYAGDEKEGIVKWDDIKDSDPATDVEAYIVGSAGKAADFVVFYSNFDKIADDTLYGIVTKSPAYDGDDWIVSIDVAGEGVKEFKDNRSSKVAKGAVIAFNVNSDNEITTATPTQTVTNAVYDISGSYIKFNAGDDFAKMTSDTVVYNENEDGLDEKLDYTDIDEGDKVEYIVVDGKVKVALIKYVAVPGASDSEVEYDAIVRLDYTYDDGTINHNADPVIYLTVDGKAKVYNIAEMILIEDKDEKPFTGTILPAGTKIVFTLAEGTNTIGYIKIVE